MALEINGQDDITLIDLMTNQPMLKCTGSILSLHDRKSKPQSAQ